MGETTTIHSVNRAIDIIEFLYNLGHEAGINEISAGIGMFGSTIYRQLNTMKERGFIYQNPENSKYWLGLRFYAIGNCIKDNLPIVNILGAPAELVAKKYRQSVFIAVPDYSSDIYAQQAIIYRRSYSAVVMRNEASVGTISPAHASATGKCMMAHYPDSLMQQYHHNPLIRLTEKTTTEWEVLDAELATIRTRGYALDSEEETEGRTCIAVPVLDSRQNVIAAISLSGQTKSIFENPVNAIVEDLTSLAEVMESKIR